jgi:hypothetical protein
MLFGAERPAGWADLVERPRNSSIAAIGIEASGGYERGVMCALLPAAERLAEMLAVRRRLNTEKGAVLRQHVKLLLLIQMTRQPTRAPLPRPMRLHCLQPHLYAIALGMLGNRAIGGKQGRLRVSSSPFIEGFDHPTLSLVLAIVDLARVQHLALHHLAARAAPALDNIPVAVFFAVLQMRWSRLSEQNLRIDKWSVRRG